MELKELIDLADSSIKRKIEELLTIKKLLNNNQILTLETENYMNGQYLGIQFLFSKDISLEQKLNIIKYAEGGTPWLQEIKEVVIYKNKNTAKNQNPISIFIEVFPKLKDFDLYNIIEFLEIGENLEGNKEIDLTVNFNFNINNDPIKTCFILKKLADKNKPVFNDLHINDFDPNDLLDIARKLDIVYSWRINIDIYEIF
jgi:hypothetical protein